MQKTNINQTVWKILAGDLAVQKDFARDIVNVRALAKYIIKTHNLRASLDSVISAVRRFESTNNFETNEEELMHIFRDSVIGTKNNIACVTIDLRPQDLFSKISNNKLFPFKVTTGSDETKIFVEQPHLEKVKKWINKEDILQIDNNLSELHVVVSEKATHTKGFLARMANELTLAHINIHELLICPPEFILYVKEKDIVKSHEAILKLCE